MDNSRTILKGLGLFGVSFIAVICQEGWCQTRVLVDQVGFETNAPKQALVVGTKKDHLTQFALVDSGTGKTVLSGDLKLSGEVYDWDGRVFWTADFSSWQTPGHYTLQVRGDGGAISSCAFDIDDNILERNTLSNVVFYFKGQRSSGLFDAADRHLALPGNQSSFVDLHGGWYDATGD